MSALHICCVPWRRRYPARSIRCGGAGIACQTHRQPDHHLRWVRPRPSQRGRLPLSDMRRSRLGGGPGTQEVHAAPAPAVPAADGEWRTLDWGGTAGPDGAPAALQVLYLKPGSHMRIQHARMQGRCFPDSPCASEGGRARSALQLLPACAESLPVPAARLQAARRPRRASRLQAWARRCRAPPAGPR